STFRELLAQVRRTTLEAYRAQDVPFDKVVEEVLPEREMDRTPLFQAMMVFQNFPRVDGNNCGLNWSFLPTWNVSAESHPSVRSDMDLYVAVGRTLSGTLVYDVELFDTSTIEQIVADLVALLENI